MPGLVPADRLGHVPGNAGLGSNPFGSYVSLTRCVILSILGTDTAGFSCCYDDRRKRFDEARTQRDFEEKSWGISVLHNHIFL
jgi:hypothetical protein